MKVLRRGEPIALLGVCATCKSVVEGTVCEAERVHGVPPWKVSFRADCPVCHGYVWLESTAITLDGTTYRAGMEGVETLPRMLTVPADTLEEVYATLDTATRAHDPRHAGEVCNRAAATLLDAILRAKKRAAK